ncbi:MAG TPA: ATP-binding protein [Candidatus Acidoferrales bacterium]|nr:ATP-binding protein [Candidatus Acidoferrales bacterium]
MFSDSSGESRVTEKEAIQLKRKVADFIRSSGDDFCLLLTPVAIGEPLKTLAPGGFPDNFAILDGADMDRIAAERNNSKRLEHLGRVLARQSGELQLSPYVPNEPAVGGRFFGRQQTLRQILASTVATSYTLVGPRRIGKTSVLMQLEKLLRDRYAPSVLKIAHLMAIRYSSTSELLGAAVAALAERGAEKEAYKYEQRPARGRKFVNFIHGLAGKTGGKRVVLMIDELDYVLEMDRNQNYDCLALLRAAFTHERCQVVFAGFRETARALTDNSTPLFGFTEPIELAGLDLAEANEMIRRPFRHMGIDIPETVVENIVERSAGHPQVITYFCHGILAFYDRERRLPRDAELEELVFGSDKFQNRITGTFLANTNMFELLFCLLLMRKALKKPGAVRDFHFDLQDIDRLLRESKVELDANAITAIVNNLRLCSIITPINRENRKFRFSIPPLVYFFRNMNLDWYIQKASKEVNMRRSNPAAIHEEAPKDAALRFLERASSA